MHAHAPTYMHTINTRKNSFCSSLGSFSLCYFLLESTLVVDLEDSFRNSSKTPDSDFAIH